MTKSIYIIYNSINKHYNIMDQISNFIIKDLTILVSKNLTKHLRTIGIGYTLMRSVIPIMNVYRSCTVVTYVFMSYRRRSLKV